MARSQEVDVESHVVGVCDRGRHVVNVAAGLS